MATKTKEMKKLVDQGGDVVSVDMQKVANRKLKYAHKVHEEIVKDFRTSSEL